MLVTSNLALKHFILSAQKKREHGPLKKYNRPQAMGVIHSDFESHFIRAEVIASKDFITHNGEAGAKKSGTWRLEGKEYIVQDGDILTIRANA